MQIENEPAWFRLNGQDGWNSYGWHISNLFYKIGKKPGKLEKRLLAIVVKEIRRDLETGQRRNRSMFDRHYSHFWGAKAAEFGKVAEEVWKEHQRSSHLTIHIADYMYRGLGRKARAIEMLFSVYNDGLLSEAGQSTLAKYLHETNRHGEAIPILAKLMELRPSNLGYRTRLMHCYFRTNQPQKLHALLKATDKYLHDNKRWVETNIAALAYSCVENQLWKEATVYYEEAISLHQRNQPNRGIGNGTLSSYYTQTAKAYSGLGDTAKAVDAASGAIVSWGPSHHQRSQALYTLQTTLQQAKDLDGYAKFLDKEAKKTGLYKPIIRKALGQVYLNKSQHEKAIPHFKIAVEMQPNDEQTHQSLLTCYKSIGDREAAIDQMFASLQLSRRNIQLYKEMALHFQQAKKQEEMERAYTSIVEVLPNETESHTALAEIRQAHGDWDSAITHWRRVSELRALEPTGLLRLLQAQIHVKKWKDASETIAKLESKAWPSRFGNLDSQIRSYKRQIKN